MLFKYVSIVFLSLTLSCPNVWAAGEIPTLFKYSAKLGKNKVFAIYGENYSDIRYSKKNDDRIGIWLLSQGPLSIKQIYDKNSEVEEIEMQKKYANYRTVLIYRKQKDNKLHLVTAKNVADQKYFQSVDAGDSSKQCELTNAYPDKKNRSFLSEIGKKTQEVYQNSKWSNEVDDKTCGPLLNNPKQVQKNLLESLHKNVNEVFSVNPSSDMKEEKNKLLQCLNSKFELDPEAEEMIPNLLQYLLTKPLEGINSNLPKQKLVQCKEADPIGTCGKPSYDSKTGVITLSVSVPFCKQPAFDKRIRHALVHESLHAAQPGKEANCETERKIERRTAECVEIAFTEIQSSDCRNPDKSNEDEGIKSVTVTEAKAREAGNELKPNFTPEEAKTSFTPPGQSLTSFSQQSFTTAGQRVPATQTYVANQPILTKVAAFFPNAPAYAGPTNFADSRPPTPTNQRAIASAPVNFAKTQISNAQPTAVSDTTPTGPSLNSPNTAAAKNFAGPASEPNNESFSELKSSGTAQNSAKRSANTRARQIASTGNSFSPSSLSEKNFQIPQAKASAPSAPNPQQASRAQVLRYMTQAPADQVQAYAMKYDKILGDRQNIMFVDSETNKVYGVKTPKPGVAMLRKQGNQIIPEDQ